MRGATVYAQGQPIDLAIAMQAAEWLATLMSGETTPAEKSAWHEWRQAHPDHERAWKHIESASGGLRELDAQASRKALTQRSRPASPISRRRSLQLLAWAATVGVTGWFGARSEYAPGFARAALADLSTSVGERRELTLPDGSRLHLNSGSAVNIRYTSTQRLLQLVQGEVFIATARETGMPYRPFLVETAQGHAQALGTRYSVRQADGSTLVAVEEGAVRLMPRHGDANPVIRAGQGLSLIHI